MSLRIIKSGVMDSVQDMGRSGYGKWGINSSGAMDRYAAQTANALVGNDLNAGVIEFHFPASEINFLNDSLITLTGANFTPLLNGEPAPLWKVLAVKKNATLSFRHKQQGNRCYLGIHGGIDVPLWFGSFSTNMKAGAGGMRGRTLKEGDTLSFGAQRFTEKNMEDDFRVFPWSINFQPVYHEPHTLFLLPGKEWDWISSETQHRVLSETFSIDPSSDRMACYLKHQPFTFSFREELLSSAVSFGTLQALPSGNSMILMADHQTTGGYPRIAHVITAHLPKLAQLSPLQKFQFVKISIEDAEKMVFSLQQDVHQLQRACRQKLEHYYAEHRS